MADAPVYESFNEGKNAGGTSVVVAKPSGVAEGDLLIGCLSSDGKEETHTSPEGDSWNVIYRRLTDHQTHTFSLWWKIATDSEPEDYTFGCGSSEALYAWVIRISGADLTAPIDLMSNGRDASAQVICPAIMTYKYNCLIIRAFGADHGDITVDGGWGSETNITVDRSSTGSGGCSGGSAYKTQVSPGPVDAETCDLTATEAWYGVTLAIQPPFAEESGMEQVL